MVKVRKIWYCKKGKLKHQKSEVLGRETVLSCSRTESLQNQKRIRTGCTGGNKAEILWNNQELKYSTCKNREEHYK